MSAASLAKHYKEIDEAKLLARFVSSQYVNAKMKRWLIDFPCKRDVDMRDMWRTIADRGRASGGDLLSGETYPEVNMFEIRLS